MSRLRRVAVLVVLAVVGVGLGGYNPAHADPPPFTEQYWNCPSTHVAYNPVTGESMRYGIAPQLLNPGQPFWLWACVDTGGMGASSIGAAGYIRTVPGYHQHTLVCPGVLLTSCVQTFTGVEVYGPSSGTVGAQPCVSPVIAEHLACQSVGVTPSPTVPASASVAPTGPGDFCGVNAAGTCIPPRTTVSTGGTLATAYVGSTPVPASVPGTCVGTSRPNTPVIIALSPSC